MEPALSPVILCEHGALFSLQLELNPLVPGKPEAGDCPLRVQAQAAAALLRIASAAPRDKSDINNNSLKCRSGSR